MVRHQEFECRHDGHHDLHDGPDRFHRHYQPDRLFHRHDRTGQPGQPQLRGVGPGQRGGRHRRPDGHRRPGPGDGGRHDPRCLLAQAQATLANDQAQLVTDQANSASASQITLDNANIASAQTQVTTAQTSLDDAALVSTIAGKVASVSLTVGQQVTASTSSAASGAGSSGTSGSGSTGSTGTGSFAGSTAAATGSAASSAASGSSSAQVIVISTGSYIVDATVNSTAVSQVLVGDQATITVSGSTTPVYGTVGSVGLLATTTSGVSSFPVVIDVTGSPAGLP